MFFSFISLITKILTRPSGRLYFPNFTNLSCKKFDKISFWGLIFFKISSPESQDKSCD